MHNRYFGAGYVLDPEYIDHDVQSVSEVMADFRETVKRLYCGDIEGQSLASKQFSTFRNKEGMWNDKKIWEVRSCSYYFGCVALILQC